MWGRHRNRTRRFTHQRWRLHEAQIERTSARGWFHTSQHVHVVDGRCRLGLFESFARKWFFSDSPPWLWWICLASCSLEMRLSYLVSRLITTFREQRAQRLPLPCTTTVRERAPNACPCGPLTLLAAFVPSRRRARLVVRDPPPAPLLRASPSAK